MITLNDLKYDSRNAKLTSHTVFSVFENTVWDRVC